jgi:hypothetical protein
VPRHHHPRVDRMRRHRRIAGTLPAARTMGEGDTIFRGRTFTDHTWKAVQVGEAVTKDGNGMLDFTRGILPHLQGTSLVTLMQTIGLSRRCWLSSASPSLCPGLCQCLHHPVGGVNRYSC